MAGEDELVLRATLDHEQVIKALDEIQAHSGKLEKSSSQNLRIIGTNLDHLTKKWEGVASTAITGLGGTSKQAKKSASELGNLRKLVEGFSKDAEGLATILSDALGGLGADQEAINQFARFDEIISRLGKSSIQAANDAGTSFTSMGNQVRSAFDQGQISAEDAASIIKNLGNIAVATGKQIDENFGRIDIAQSFRTEEAQAKFENLRQVASTLMEDARGPAQEFGRQLNSDLDRIEQNLEDSGGSTQAFAKDVNALNSKFNTTLKTSKDIKDELNRIRAAAELINKEAQIQFIDPDNEDILRGMTVGTAETLNQIDLIKARFKEFFKTIKTLMASDDANVRQMGARYEALGRRIEGAFEDASDSENFHGFGKGLDEIEDGLGRLQNKASTTGRAMGESFRETTVGANKSTVSVWKLGTALDRVGVRGAGGIARVVDVVKELPLPIIAGAIAVGGLLLALNKVIDVVIDLGRKAAEAFVEFTKGAVEVSKNLEVLERQFIGLLGGSEELARAFRDNLLDLSVIVGQDLTQDFSRLLVPLTSNQAQIEEFAKTMSALSVSIPATEFERVVSVVRQMISGRFRGAKDTLGFTDAEVKRVQDFQKEMGVTAGTLEGLGILLDRLGVSFDGVSNTLIIAEGRMKAFRVQIEEALGEPIKDELGEIFSRLTDFIADNKTEVLDFINFVGEVVSDVISHIADAVDDMRGEIDDTDIQEFQTAIADLGESVKGLVDSVKELVSSEDTNIIDYMTKATEAVGSLVDKTSDLVDIVDRLGEGIKFAGDIPFIGDVLKNEVNAFGFVLKAIEANITSPFRAVETFGKAIRGALDPDVNFGKGELWNELLGEMFFWLDTDTKAADDLGDALNEITSPEVKFLDRAPVLQDEHIDLQLEYKAALTDFNNIVDDAADAQEEINEAQAALALERTQREMRTQTEFSRRVLKLENDLSRQREDIHRKFGERINELNIDWQNSLLELEVTFDRKEEDILRDFNDKTEDLARDSTDKKIDIEKKFRDKLKEIRAKFDFDAQEAIRMNDAVALLRIRRRMAFELQQAKDRKDDDINQVNEQEERKTRDLNIWLERQRRDAEIAEDRKLEDLIASDMQKRAELGRQYKFELEQQRINEQRKRDDLAQWRKWEDEDTQTWFDQQNAKLTIRLQEQYDIIAKAKEAQLRLARAYNRLISQALAVQIPTGLLTSGSGLNPLQLAPGFGTGVRIRDISPVQLTPGGRQFGGFQTPGGRPTLVGERRPEPFYPTQAGVISPHVPLMMSTGIGSGGASIDNSRNVSADISTLDPSQVSPIQQTIIKSIFMDQMLALTFGE